MDAHHRRQTDAAEPAPTISAITGPLVRALAALAIGVLLAVVFTEQLLST